MAEVNPPAAAYHLVRSLLPFDWFTTPAPMEGVALTIIGTDGVRTVWHFDDRVAAAVEGLLSRRPTQARVLARERFDHTDEARA